MSDFLPSSVPTAGNTARRSKGPKQQHPPNGPVGAPDAGLGPGPRRGQHPSTHPFKPTEVMADPDGRTGDDKFVSVKGV